MNDLILQQGSGAYEPLLRVSEPLTVEYARLHGMDFKACFCNVGARWHTNEKWLLNLQAMANTGRLIGMWDADLLAVGREDWREAMGDADFAAVMNESGELNCGAYFIRDTTKAIAFLKTCVMRLEVAVVSAGSIYVDQRVLNQELCFSGLKVKTLNRRWNDYGFACGQTDGPVQIKGFHSLETTPDQKLRHMQQYLVRRRDEAA